MKLLVDIYIKVKARQCFIILWRSGNTPDHAEWLKRAQQVEGVADAVWTDDKSRLLVTLLGTHKTHEEPQKVAEVILKKLGAIAEHWEVVGCEACDSGSHSRP